MRRRGLIVDDEPLARRELRRLLAARDDVAVIAEASSVAGARRELARCAIDLVFLDIQLRSESGFDLLEGLSADVEVIFVTAFDEHAVRAFEVEATDYLLKPVAPERLAMALERLGERRSTWRPGDRLRLRSGRKHLFVRLEDIVAVTAERDYTRVLLFDGDVVLVHRTMRRWERRLPRDSFARIHRSTIVNVGHIVGVETGPGRTMRVALDKVDGDFAVSRTVQPRLRRALL